MSKLQGLVNRIIPFSVVDGPGNRFVIFLQGCNFNCIACHNPQTIGLCDACGVCVLECPGNALLRNSSESRIDYDISLCENCDTCIQVCPVDSNPHSQWMSIDTLMEKIRSSAPFLSGITVSGGEATQQSEFVFSLFQQIKSDEKLNYLSTFIDSNGSTELSTWERLLPVTDGVMVDLKALDDGIHQKMTEASNRDVLESIRFLEDAGKLYELRLLLVPGWNDQPELLEKTANWLQQLNLNRHIKLIGFRKHGVRSHPELENETVEEKLESTKLLFQKYGLSNIQVI